MDERMSYRVLLSELADFGYPEEAGVRSEIAQWAARKVAQATTTEREACASLVDEIACIVALTGDGLASNEYGYVAAKIRGRRDMQGPPE